MDNWDLSRLRNIAGVKLTESFGDDDHDNGDDDMSSSERELASTADRDLKKKGIKVGKVDPDKDLSKLAKSDKDKKDHAAGVKKEEPKAVPKKEEPAAKKTDAAPKVETKKAEETPAEEAKRRGRAPSDTSKSGHGRAFMQKNPKATRGEFIKHMQDNHGMSKLHASANYYVHKNGASKGVKEGYMLSHPFMPNFLLAENREMGQMQWVDPYSPLEVLFLETKEEAEKIAKYMKEWKGQDAVINLVKLEDDTQ